MGEGGWKKKKIGKGGSLQASCQGECFHLRPWYFSPAPALNHAGSSRYSFVLYKVAQRWRNAESKPQPLLHQQIPAALEPSASRGAQHPLLPPLRQHWAPRRGCWCPASWHAAKPQGAGAAKARHEAASTPSPSYSALGDRLYPPSLGAQWALGTQHWASTGTYRATLYSSSFFLPQQCPGEGMLGADTTAPTAPQGSTSPPVLQLHHRPSPAPVLALFYSPEQTNKSRATQGFR